MSSNLLPGQAFQEKIKELTSDICANVMSIRFSYAEQVKDEVNGLNCSCVNVDESNDGSIKASATRDGSLLYVYSDSEIRCLDADSMFKGMTRLCKVQFDNFDTSSCTTMKSMFKGCSSLTSLNLKGFNTENVENFSNMFADCISCYYINVSTFAVPSKAASCSTMNMLLNTDSLRMLTVGKSFAFNSTMSLADPRNAANSAGTWNFPKYLKSYASQDMPSNVSGTFYACNVDSSEDDSKLVTLGALKKAARQIANAVKNSKQ